MAFSAHKDPELIKEHSEPLEVLQEKAKKFIKLIKKSSHFIAFTGMIFIKYTVFIS